MIGTSEWIISDGKWWQYVAAIVLTVAGLLVAMFGLGVNLFELIGD
jgi:hypothetical protein